MSQVIETNQPSSTLFTNFLMSRFNLICDYERFKNNLKVDTSEPWSDFGVF